MEAGMATRKAKDTYGYLGTESIALREQVERLTAAIEQAAKTEGAEAVKAAGEAAREVLARAATMVDELAGKADAAKAAAGEGRAELESAIRDKPLVAVSLAALAGFLLATLIRR
jgi:ElaB/YqjD/DUF883 family membrane-anchored ribosome-binding protein